jgi:hypothetical protein
MKKNVTILFKEFIVDYSYKSYSCLVHYIEDNKAKGKFAIFIVDDINNFLSLNDVNVKTLEDSIQDVSFDDIVNFSKIECCALVYKDIVKKRTSFNYPEVKRINDLTESEFNEKVINYSAKLNEFIKPFREG